MFCLCTHSLQFNQCYRVHAVKRAKRSFPSRLLQKFALFSALLTTEVHSELSPTSAAVHPTRISLSLSTLCTCCTTVLASGYLFMMTWHWEFSDVSVCVQYFRSPGTGASAILVYKQVHRKVKSAKTVLVQITKSNKDGVSSQLRITRNIRISNLDSMFELTNELCFITLRRTGCRSPTRTVYLLLSIFLFFFNLYSGGWSPNWVH
jgi:hypothetical protein